MKPLALNLSKMKKVAGDKNSSTFLHPSGHKMMIAHDGVSALHRNQLEKMPIQKMAEGGAPSLEERTAIYQNAFPNMSPADIQAKAQADTDSQAATQASAVSDQDQKLKDQADQDRSQMFNGNQAQAPDQVAAPSESNPAQRSPSSLPQLSQPQKQPSTLASASMGADANIPAAYRMGQQSISEQQKIDEAKSKANADIQTQDMAKRQDLNKNFQDSLNTFNDHQKQFMQDYMNNHINPNHYVENMSTGSKVASAIGMLLGGASSSVTGRNPAADFLKQQIDRDIAAQSSRQDQQKTLLGANQALFHDNVMAMNQTRINMNDIYDHQIQLAASKLGTPQAKANADAKHAQFAIENAALLQQNAMRSTVMNHLKQGGSDVNAIDLANAGLIPKEEAVKEQSSIDAQKTAIAKTRELYSALNKEQTFSNILNPQSERRVEALNAELVNAVMNASASKRLTRESVEAEIGPLKIKTTDDDKTREDKEQGLLNIVERHADTTPYMSHFVPGSLPKYRSSVQNPLEGKTASDGKGNRIVMKNGQWVPYGG